MANTTLASYALKIMKLILNFIALIMYRYGDQGFFLGGSFNKNRDVETLVSGVYVGFLIYNIAVLLAALYDDGNTGKSFTETLMNLTGFIMWVSISGVVLQFWLRFIAANQIENRNPKAVGIAMGVLTLLNSVLYLGDTAVAYAQYRKEANKY